MQNSESTPTLEPVSKPVLRRRHPIRLFFLALLAILLISAVVGVLSGQQLRIERERILNQARVEEQYTLALQDLQQGQFAVAAQRLEYILSIQPEYPGARENLDKAHAGMNATPSPQPTETPVPSPTPDVSRGEQLMLKAEQQFKDGDYRGMYETLLTLKVEVPTYNAVRADGLMWAALRYEGISLINKGRLSEGMYYLDLSENYAPSDSKAADRTDWSLAVLSNYQGAYVYLARAEDEKAADHPTESMEYYDKSVQYFEQLYTLAPGFRTNIFNDYVSTLRDYGKTLMDNGNVCLAFEQFDKALTHLPDNEELATLRDQAQQLCSPPVVPTPTIAATLEP